MPPDVPQHAIRDGDYRVIYVSANGALYKMFPDAGIILPFLPVAVGEQGHMAGYLGWAKAIYRAAIIAGTTANQSAPSQGVWLYHSADGTTWNWEKRANGLPLNVNWYGLFSNPKNASEWVAVHAITNQNLPTPDVSMLLDPTTGASVMYHTTDAGMNWSPVDLPTLPRDPNGYVSLVGPICGWHDDGTFWAVAVHGWYVGDWFNRFVMWEGASPAALGTNRFVMDFSSPYFGFDDAQAGMNGDVVIGGNLGGWPGYDDENAGYIPKGGTVALSNPKDTGRASGIGVQYQARMAIARMATYPENLDGGMFTTSDYRIEQEWARLPTEAQLYGSAAPLRDGTFILGGGNGGAALYNPFNDTVTLYTEVPAGSQGTGRVKTDVQNRAVAAAMSRVMGVSGNDFFMFDGKGWGQVGPPANTSMVNNLAGWAGFDVLSFAEDAT